VKVITHPHLVPRSRMVELYLHCPIRLHDVLLNYTQGQLCSSTLSVLTSPVTWRVVRMVTDCTWWHKMNLGGGGG
jgi:hypothetical protein